MSQWGDIYPGVQMGVRELTSSLFLVASILALPGYGQPDKNRLIVRFKEGINSFSADTIHQALGIESSKKLNQIGKVEVIELPQNTYFKEAQKFYADNPNVLYAEPDFKIRIDPIATRARVKSTPYSQQWALENLGQKVGKFTGKEDADINAPEAWKVTKGDREVVLGIIDTGIFYTHPDLKDNIWENSAEIVGNGKDDDGNVFVDDIHGINALNRSGDPLDDNGHGTHVSGIMGASGLKGKGVFGVNQKVLIVGCKFLDSEGNGSMSDALICMDYFAKLKTREENPVNLVAINASWGGPGSSRAMKDAIQALGDLGILFVVAAGNDSLDNDRVSNFPANYKLANIISVAATNNRDELAYFSNYGRRSVHVGAPGMDIMSTYLGDGYEIFSGTSMAAPYVTGLIGLLKSSDSDLNWKQLKNLVIAGGSKLDILSEKTISGRRIRAADEEGRGSLTCDKQRFSSRLSHQSSIVSAKVGDAVEFSVLKIRCGDADDAPKMTVNMGRTVDFLDLDQDGVYSAQWIADAPGEYDFDLGDTEKVTVHVTQ